MKMMMFKLRDWVGLDVMVSVLGQTGLPGHACPASAD
jgi:hypothetical protein